MLIRDRKQLYPGYPDMAGRIRRGQLVSPFPDTSFLGGKIAAPGSFHVAAYTASLGSVTNNDTAALIDGILYIQNGHFLPQVDSSIIWAWCGGTTLSRVRFNSPKFRQINPNYIRPISLFAIPANNDNMVLMPPGRLVVRGLEELVAEISTTGAGPAQTTLAFGLQANFVPVPSGDIFNFRFTATTTLVANKWTSVPITFETLPPVGTYAVIGAEVQSANGQAFRFTFDGQYYRPGLPCITALTNRQLWADYYGALGVWGYFRTTNLPRLEILANAADTSQEGYLEVVRVG
jgi:hypothetical protein